MMEEHGGTPPVQIHLGLSLFAQFRFERQHQDSLKFGIWYYILLAVTVF